MPNDERLESSDATMVDIVHTDSDHLGTSVILGHTDFYIGSANTNFGSDQAGCYDFSCDHSRSWEIVLASLRNRESCWATVLCTRPEGNTLNGCQEITDRPHVGYFYDGTTPGVYGVA